MRAVRVPAGRLGYAETGASSAGSVHGRVTAPRPGAVRGSVNACAQTCRRAHPGRVHPARAVLEACRPRSGWLGRQGTDLGRRGPGERRTGDQARAAAASWRRRGARRPCGPRCPAARAGCRLSRSPGTVAAARAQPSRRPGTIGRTACRSGHPGKTRRAALPQQFRARSISHSQTRRNRTIRAPATSQMAEDEFAPIRRSGAPSGQPDVLWPSCRWWHSVTGPGGLRLVSV